MLKTEIPCGAYSATCFNLREAACPTHVFLHRGTGVTVWPSTSITLRPQSHLTIVQQIAPERSTNVPVARSWHHSAALPLKVASAWREIVVPPQKGLMVYPCPSVALDDNELHLEISQKKPISTNLMMDRQRLQWILQVQQVPNSVHQRRSQNHGFPASSAARRLPRACARAAQRATLAACDQSSQSSPKSCGASSCRWEFVVGIQLKQKNTRSEDMIRAVENNKLENWEMMLTPFLEVLLAEMEDNASAEWAFCWLQFPLFWRLWRYDLLNKFTQKDYKRMTFARKIWKVQKLHFCYSATPRPRPGRNLITKTPKSPEGPSRVSTVISHEAPPGRPVSSATFPLAQWQ